MDNSSIRLPIYAKLAQIILGLIGVFYILYIGQDIIIPVVLATVIAIVLNPIVNYLVRKKVNRIVAICISLLIVMLITAGLGYFIVSQIAMLGDTLPQFKEKFKIFEDDVLRWMSQTFNIRESKINAWITQTKKGIDGGAIIGQTLNTLKGLAVLVILPVYTFLIIFYKPLILNFISQLFKNDEKGVVTEVLAETKSLIQNYLVGLSIETVIVAILNSIGLMIIGVEYAILLGLIGALLNIIPYIGGLIAISLPVILALATQSASAALWVIIVYLVVQFIDNQFLVPKIVASKVKINALISIIVVLIGGAMWGVPGMFLSIPMTAIIKVIFDRIEPLKPFGYILGDDQPEFGKVKLISKRKKKE